MRLIDDMRREADNMGQRFHGYALCGERELSRSAIEARSSLIYAIAWLEHFYAVERQLQSTSKEA